MKVVGIESASQEIRDAMGRCEVCGEQATAVVRDFLETFGFTDYTPKKIEPGEWHRFCDEHDRKSVITQIREGESA